MENIEGTINSSAEITKKKKSRDKNYTERIKRNKEKIVKLETIILNSKNDIEKIEQENADILREVLKKSSVEDKLLKIILESSSSDETAKKMKELTEVL
jgi:LPXTG anchored putative adhesin